MEKKSFINKALRLFIVLVISLVLIILASVVMFYRSIMDGVKESANNYLALYGKDVDATISESEYLLNGMVYDNTEYVLLQSAEESTRYFAVMSLKSELDSCISNDFSASFICIAENNYQNFVMAEKKPATVACREELQKFMFDCVAQVNMKSQWNCVELDGAYYMYKLYIWQGRGAGVFVPVDELLTDLEKGSNVSIILQDNKGIVYGGKGTKAKAFELGQELPEQRANSAVETVYEICNGRFVIRSFTDIREVTEQVKAEGVFLNLVLICAVAFAMIGAKSLRREVVNPMQHMQENMKRIEQGDYKHRIEEEYNNSEFEALKHAFNKMLDEIVELKIHHYEKQIELSESELRSIRLQIRPHFFLNALTTISSLSMQGKNKEITTYIESLSKNVRYMFKSGIHTVELAEEIKHVENYFEMQELKYPNCVFYFISCSEDLMGWRVPQMIIHTIIENEYKYAVSMDSLLSIYINIETVERESETLLKIEIQDDGEGYPKEILEHFDSDAKRSNDGSRVGLWSIKKMLQIMYEEDNLFTISNIEPHGCSNIIFIPAEPKHEVGQEVVMKPLE